MKYNPSSIFQDPAVVEELQRLSDLLGIIVADKIPSLYVEPKRFSEGLVAICDGVDWDPLGDGIKRPVWYDADAEEWKAF